jgi:hypothetical protein
VRQMFRRINKWALLRFVIWATNVIVIPISKPYETSEIWPAAFRSWNGAIAIAVVAGMLAFAATRSFLWFMGFLCPAHRFSIELFLFERLMPLSKPYVLVMDVGCICLSMAAGILFLQPFNDQVLMSSLLVLCLAIGLIAAARTSR